MQFGNILFSHRDKCNIDSGSVVQSRRVGEPKGIRGWPFSAEYEFASQREMQIMRFQVIFSTSVYWSTVCIYIFDVAIAMTFVASFCWWVYKVCILLHGDFCSCVCWGFQHVLMISGTNYDIASHITKGRGLLSDTASRYRSAFPRKSQRTAAWRTHSRIRSAIPSSLLC